MCDAAVLIPCLKNTSTKKQPPLTDGKDVNYVITNIVLVKRQLLHQSQGTSVDAEMTTTGQNVFAKASEHAVKPQNKECFNALPLFHIQSAI